MKAQIIHSVRIFPFTLKPGRNGKQEFRMRCREIMDDLGLGRAWDDSHFDEKGSFDFRVGFLSPVIGLNLGEKDQSVIFVSEDGTVSEISLPVLNFAKGRFHMRFADRSPVEIFVRDLNHLERLGLEAIQHKVS